MLCDSKIKAVVDNVKDCHHQLIVHGTRVILDGMATSSPLLHPVGASTLAGGIETPLAAAAPKAVLLHWGAQPPIIFNQNTILKRVHSVNPYERRDVPAFCLVQDKERRNKAANINKAMGPQPVDLVFWHVGQRTLDLQADTHFTETTVTNALAREIALNAAKTMLFHELDRFLDEGRSDDCFDEDSDSQIVSFTDRLKANIDRLLTEARSAPEALSRAPPMFSREVEDGLREAIAKNNRHDSEWEEHQRSLPAKEEAFAAALAAAAVTGGPTPARPSTRMVINTAPISATELAASPPVVLRPFEGIYSVFSETEIMTIFKKTVLSRNDCSLCPGYEVRFKHREGGGSKHEYNMDCGPNYCHVIPYCIHQ